MSAKCWAMAVIAACMLSPATGWAQSDALLDDYNQYVTFYAQGKYQEALPFALRLVELHKSEFGADHPTAAVLYANIADIHAEIEWVQPLTSAVLFNNVAELFSAQGRTFGAVMPRLAERMEGEEAPPEMAPVEIVEAPEEVIVAAVEPVEDAAPSGPEMIPEEVTVGEFIEETVDTPATETTRETSLERAASEAAEVEIIVEAPEPEEAGETVIAAAEVTVEQEIEIIVEPEPEIVIEPEPEQVVVALELDSEPEPEPELVVEADSEIRNLAIEE
jgi:hypothetical protein